jgi:hypothetical protein
MRDQRVAPLVFRPPAKQSLLKFHQRRTNRLRASQNAAALLFEFAKVDIRRVGTQTSEYSSRGVPSKASIESSSLRGQR